MKETKRRLETFSFYDHTGIEAHLARMAEQGWLLEKIGNFFWYYRRIEPKTLTFSVSYFPKASQFDPGPSEEQETFYDFCQHTGWTLAAASAQLQVFYNERPNPVPIDTDPALEIDAIHKSAKRSWLLSLFSLLAVSLMQEAIYLWQLFDDPVRTLSSALMLFAMVDYVLLLLVIVVELGSYYSWRRRAKQAAEQGEFLPTRGHPILQKMLLAVVTVGLVWLLASLAFEGNPELALIMGWAVCATLAMTALVWGISGVLKRKKASADTNRAVTLTLAVVLSIAVVVMIPLMILGMNRGGSRRPLERGQLPLALPELLDMPADDENLDHNVFSSQSPLLGYLNTNQYLHPQKGSAGPQSHWLDYTVVEVKAPFLYGLCRDQFLNQWEDDSYWDRSYVPVDPVPWGAEEAYLEQDAEYGAQNQYLLCYSRRVVEVYFDWAPTPEQMALAGERLGG